MAEEAPAMQTTTTAIPTEEEADRSFLSTPSQSDLEKPSPAPGSIHSTSPNAEEDENKETTNDAANSNEIVYPSNLTKVLVGIGLALAVFLVCLLMFTCS